MQNAVQNAMQNAVDVLIDGTEPDVFGETPIADATALDYATPPEHRTPLDHTSPVSLSELAPLTPNGASGEGSGIELLFDVSLQISVELGRTRMTIGEVLALRANSVIELDKLAGEPADIFV